MHGYHGHYAQWKKSVSRLRSVHGLLKGMELWCGEVSWPSGRYTGGMDPNAKGMGATREDFLLHLMFLINNGHLHTYVILHFSTVSLPQCPSHHPNLQVLLSHNSCPFCFRVTLPSDLLLSKFFAAAGTIQYPVISK